MADIVQKIEDLTGLDEGIHWFCPRTNDDYGLYFDEDVQSSLRTESTSEKEQRLAKVKEAEGRRSDVLEAFKILAFDGADAAPYQKRLNEGLQTQLTRCDVCVREYHRARGLLELSLDSQYEADEVRLFMEKYDDMNKQRIAAGLDTMTENLIDLPPDQRTITAVGDAGMYALFEAFNCGPFLRDESALRKHFDRPFKLVQTNKRVKLPSYAPGMVAFLFSHDEQRSSWAVRNFGTIKRPLAGAEFEHSVKPYLLAAINRVHIVSLELEFLPIFWKATHLIISKLTKDVIAHHLRGMDANLYTVAMEHFQVDSTHFPDLVDSYRLLLELSPVDFWDAMGAINAQNVVEGIFSSPVFQRDLKDTEEREPLNLEAKLAWTLPLVRSIKPANLVPPIRVLLDQLLRNTQDESYSNYARNVTWRCGLEAMLETLRIIARQVQGGPVVIHLLEVISKDYIQLIMQELEGIEKKDEQRIEQTEMLGLDIVEALLSLDVQSLAHARKIIERTKALDHENGASSDAIWKLSMRLVKPGYPGLAIAILSGSAGLLSLEKFSTRQIQTAPKPSESWNGALQRLYDHLETDFIERLESFTPEQLTELFMEQKGANGLMALIFSSEPTVHQAALNILKVLSTEDNRRDSIKHIVVAFLGTTMSAAAEAQKTIAASRAFGPCSTMLKLSTDILGCLCDSQDGVLRSKTDVKDEDITKLETLWQTTWTALETIFGETEKWSNLGHDKQLMQDFCRETMDFAAYAFDQYAVIANTLQQRSDKDNSTREVGRQLLAFPAKAFASIAKWLRLRDDYLIAKAVDLTSKMLSRLRDVGLEINEAASAYIADVVLSVGKGPNKIRTNLSSNQKAELRRALEKHIGASLETESNDTVKKQSSLAGWASSGRSTPTAESKPRGSTIDVDAWSAASEAQRQRKQMADENDKAYKSLMRSATSATDAWKKEAQSHKAPVPAKVTQRQQDDQKNFLLKRKQEKEAADKRRAEALAKQKLGAGSGVLGLGDMGKDHALKGQNVMVSSDEESDDDDEDLDDDLFGSSKNKTKKRLERPNVDPNGALGLKPEVKKGPTRIQRVTRNAKDMRARLAPDLQPLHRTILGWDYFHDGHYPPGSDERGFLKVANSFGDPTTYQATFQPLLTLEAWQNMVKSREDNAARPYEIKVSNRTNVDSFIEISSLIGHAENRDLSLSEGDIILLSKVRKPADDATAPHCLARVYRVKRQKAHFEIVYQVMPSSSLASSLITGQSVYGLKVQSIIPLEREYGALQGLQYYDLCLQITRASPSKRISYSDKQIAHCQDVWNVNRAQSEAINAALENDGFSLIQGPPGSGKTKTIVAIVGGLLSHTLSSSSNGATKINMPRGTGFQAQSNGGDVPSRKLLVCAPSNAAVDELVMRLNDGVKTKSGRHHSIKVVRIGRSDAINTQVADVTMEALVTKRLGGNQTSEATRARNAELFKEHEKVSGELRDMYQKRDGGEVKGQDLVSLETNIVAVRKHKNELGVRIDSVKDQERNAGREAELNRKRAQQAVLDEAQVICATLSGSGHDMFQSLNIEFETVIIDEAAQCVEMSSLIPLKYGCVKCIMVGDPNQLPPTVFSREAKGFQYEQSLFVRMQNNFPNEVHLLDTQYRMHPDISVFPSRTFYDGLLKDGDGMAALRQKPWHASALLAPYRFFDVSGKHQSAPGGHSLVNVAEIEVAMALYERLRTDHKQYDFAGRIGVITPYKSQLRMLKDRFSTRFGSDITDMIEFNTTDAFQGRESEIIIFSCVRASLHDGIGFLQDIRRMNVGLTRAKSSLWVLGNAQSLEKGRYWKMLVDDARARDRFTTGNIMGMLKKPSITQRADTSNTVSMYDIDSHVAQVKSNGSTAPDQPSDPRKQHSERKEAIAAVKSTTANKSDPRSTSLTPKPDPDRMEGVSYRFQDRVKLKPSRAGSETGSDRSSLQALGKGSEDVEMTDAGPAGRSGKDSPYTSDAAATFTDGATDTRAESAHSRSKLEQDNRDGAPMVKRPPTLVNPAMASGIAKKRTTASPFMPSKKPKPRK